MMVSKASHSTVAKRAIPTTPTTHRIAGKLAKRGGLVAGGRGALGQASAAETVVLLSGAASFRFHALLAFGHQRPSFFVTSRFVARGVARSEERRVGKEGRCRGGGQL